MHTKKRAASFTAGKTAPPRNVEAWPHAELCLETSTLSVWPARAKTEKQTRLKIAYHFGHHDVIRVNRWVVISSSPGAIGSHRTNK